MSLLDLADRAAIEEFAHRVRDGAEILRFRSDEMSKDRPKTWARFRELLGTLPAWATTTRSARTFPPQPALFDLVVIDEAAQCSIPDILPMFYRARRALIIGDPRQLAPVITLPGQEEPQQQAEAGLSGEWLESRRLLYQRRLTVLTDQAGLTAPAEPAMRWQHVAPPLPGRRAGHHGGLTVRRVPAWRCYAEPDLIVAELAHQRSLPQLR